jgi:hypothetical protein
VKKNLRKKDKGKILAVLLAVMLIVSCMPAGIAFAAAPAAPTVTGISPAGGPTIGGTSVIITGTDLTVATAVYFGATAVSSFVYTAADGTITVTSPAEAAGTVDVAVYDNTNGKSITHAPFTYGPPTVSGINPAYGLTDGGTSVTITGTNLTVPTYVYFGSNRATSVTPVTATSITAISPAAASAGAVDVTVYTPGGSSAVNQPADEFTYYTYTGGGGGGSAVTTSTTTPTVQTEAATVVTANSAALNGDITSDNGYAVTDYGFLWGTSSSSLTNKLDVGTDNHSGAFTDTLSSLTAGTTYYFEAYATNSYGTADGAVMSFTTMGTTTTPIFSDVPATYWGYDAIISLASRGIISGYPDGTFRPDAYISRAEFSAMLAKALGLNTSGTTGTFTDVTAYDWYYGSVNAAASADLVSGIGDKLFAPNAMITREQMAVAVTKALGSKTPATNGTELNAFIDGSAVSSWAKSGVDESVKAGIVIGMTADTLAPLAEATRAQEAAMIYKMLAFLGK